MCRLDCFVYIVIFNTAVTTKKNIISGFQISPCNVTLKYKQLFTCTAIVHKSR